MARKSLKSETIAESRIRACSAILLPPSRGRTTRKCQGLASLHQFFCDETDPFCNICECFIPIVPRANRLSVLWQGLQLCERHRRPQAVSNDDGYYSCLLRLMKFESFIQLNIKAVFGINKIDAY